MGRPPMIRAARARSRPRVVYGHAALDLPELFGRQSSTDCSGGTSFYRCSLNNFAGCCSVDPCDMPKGCPDDAEDDKDSGAGKDVGKGPPVVVVTRTVIDRPVSDTPTTSTRTTRTTESGAVLPTDLDDVPRDKDEDEDEVEGEDEVNSTGGGGGGGGDDGADNDPVGIDSDSGGGGLSPGAMAGIIVGVVVVLFILVALVCLRQRRRRKATAAHAADGPPPMDANDEKFLSSMDPSSADAAAAGQQAGYSDALAAASSSSESKIPSPVPTPSTLGGDQRHSVAGHSYVSSITTAAGSPPPGAPSFPGNALAPPPALVEMDGVDSMRPSELAGPDPNPPPSELPAGPAPARAPPGGPGGLATVAENEPRSAGGLLRGTLNPTDGEKSRQTYVTSWAQFDRGSK